MERSLAKVSGTRPGGHELRREVLVHHQRERILAAAVELIAERGYRPVSVADIVKRAAIARSKFYENFGSKEDCFFAAYDRAAEEALRRVGEGADCADSERPFPERLRAGLAAFLGYLAADPALARACIVEAPAVGPAMRERRERALAGFAALLAGARTGGAELPETAEESVLDGLYWLIYYAILDGRPRRIEDLLEELTVFALISLAGPEGAREAAA